MKFSLSREAFLKPLLEVSPVVERRQTLPVLFNLLVKASDGEVELTATDLEVEMISSAQAKIEQEGETTIPARKLVDIVRSLPDGAEIKMDLSSDKVTVSAGRSRFKLATLPSEEFPAIADVDEEAEFSLDAAVFRSLLGQTQFAMAQQDVRYYLNGLLLAFTASRLRAVATDGHRLALCEEEVSFELDEREVIVPRKAIGELLRSISDDDGALGITLGSSHIRVRRDDSRFTSKLIEGRFPDYRAVVPSQNEHEMTVERKPFRQALSRASILANEKYRGIRLEVGSDVVQIRAHNPEQEEAVVELPCQYQGPELAVGFNVNYLLDALGALEADEVTVKLKDGNSSALIEGVGQGTAQHVVMPLRL